MSHEEANFLHDLSAPLSGAILKLEVLLADLPVDDQRRESIRQALNLVERVVQLVRDRKAAIR
jgi:signal transduction histidine kinase